jgi:nitrite transporter NirC
MYTETINKCAANAARINRFERSDKLGFWLSSAMAGAYVGLGIILIFTLGNLVDPSIRPLVMGATFGIALTLVIIAGSELFTGHTMFLTFGVKTGKITMADLLRILPQTWAGNLIGSIAVALIYSYGGSLLPDAGSLAHKVALAKTQAPALTLFMKGVLCNWLVCLAIWMALRTEGAAKFIAIWWCLLAFIASGYEHSIANMTLFALSWFGAHRGLHPGRHRPQPAVGDPGQHRLRCPLHGPRLLVCHPQG